MAPHPGNRVPANKRFLKREADGTVRLRMRFQPEEAASFEEAAGDRPVIEWMYEALRRQATADIEARRAARPVAPPPTD